MTTFICWLVRSFIMIFWICDILNMPFMEIFDTTYPFNTAFWILILNFVIDIKVGKLRNEKSKN